MSSNEEDYNDGDHGTSQSSKKRRIQRACDICRRKKIRCDGGQMPGNRCSNCIAYNFDCTYVEAAKKRGPPKGYVEKLENQVEKLEKLLHKLCPDEQVLKELDATIDIDNWAIDNAPKSDEVVNPRTVIAGHRDPCDIATTVIRRFGTDTGVANDDDFAHLVLADNLKQLHIDPHEHRFFGKSSGAMLIHTAIQLKNEYTGGNDDIRRPILGSKRSEFWSIRPWERAAHQIQKPTYIFPENDLMITLIDYYFERINLYFPLLHRPTFEKAVAQGLHLTNDGFAATLLLVCAVGSRYSDDPRVRLEDDDAFYSSGWKWFEQVQSVKKSLMSPPTLYDLQFYCLSVIYLQGTSAPQSCWAMIGIGIRLAQDVGAHRRKYDRKSMTMEDEMWKRAFWILVCMDQQISSALGRPCAIQDENFDLDFPVECDDEYWDHPDPAQRFKQPPNKPSLITCFNLYLKLNQVVAILLRTIYSINKSKIILGFVGAKWEQHIVTELDSALNKWVDSVPDHLRWDPTRQDVRFFNQSLMLYCTYYHTQILIHRPFIPSPSKPSPLAFPSLAICTNAARSCSHIIDTQRRRGEIAPPQIQMIAFTAGVVLLLNIWGGKRSGLATDPKREMSDVHKCMQVLRASEGRWHAAGRLWDLLYELASVGDLPLPGGSPSANNKRDRDADSPASSCAESSTSSVPSDVPRAIAGSRRVTRDTCTGSLSGSLVQQQQPQTHQPPHQQIKLEYAPFPLPVYSNDLGRLPLHRQVPSFPRDQSSQDNLQVPHWYPTSITGSGPLHSAPVASYPQQQTGTNMESSFPVDTLGIYDQLGPSYPSPFVQSSSSTPGIQTPFGDSMNVMQSLDAADSQRTAMMEGQFGLLSPGMAANMQALIDNDTIAMWSNAPTGFELDDWGTYLTNVSELTHGLHHVSGTNTISES